MTIKHAIALREQLLTSLASLHAEFDFFDEDGPIETAADTTIQIVRELDAIQDDPRPAVLATLDELIEIIEEEGDPDDDEEEDAEEEEDEPAELVANPMAAVEELICAAGGVLAPVAAGWLAQQLAPPQVVGPQPVPDSPRPYKTIYDEAGVPMGVEPDTSWVDDSIAAEDEAMREGWRTADESAAAESVQKGTPKNDDSVIDITDFRPVDS